MFFLSLILYIRDFGIQIFIPLYIRMALSVSWRMRTWDHMHLGSGS